MPILPLRHDVEQDWSDPEFNETFDNIITDRRNWQSFTRFFYQPIYEHREFVAEDYREYCEKATTALLNAFMRAAYDEDVPRHLWEAVGQMFMMGGLAEELRRQGDEKKGETPPW